MPLTVAQMQLLDEHIEWVGVLLRIAFGDNDFVPEVHIFQGLYDGLVVAFLPGIDIKTHAAWKQVCVLWQPNESRADCLAG